MTPRTSRLLIAAALVAAVAAVYWPVRHFGFVDLDDNVYVYNNPSLSPGLTPAGLRWAFTTFHAGNYHPLVWVSFLFDRSAWHLRPGPMHAENVALHAANAVLLFGLLRRATGRTWPAAFVAAVFAVHPAHVESVAWVTERKDVLSTALWLAAAHAYVTFVRSGSWRAYAAVVGAFAASLLAKPMGVTFPAVLLLLDVWPLGRRATGPPTPWSRLLAEKVPLAVMAAAAAAATSAAQRAAGAVSSLATLPPSARAGNAAVAYVRYLGQTLWPHDLAAFYPFRWPLPAATVAGAVLLLVGLTIVAVRVRRPPVLVGWLWFLGTLVPVVGLVQVGSQSHADRYLYLPMVGLTLAAFAVDVPRRARPVVAAATIAVLVALAVAARQQVGFWSDTATLKDRILAVADSPGAVHVKYGADAAAAGDVAEAERQFLWALRFDPADATALFDLGNLRLRAGRQPGAAADCYRRAAAARPGVAAVEANWGVALLQLGRPAEAYPHLRAAERLDPDLFDPHFNLGLMLTPVDRRAAAAEFADAVRCDPSSAAARARLAEAAGR